jgi:hypothetical protein
MISEKSKVENLGLRGKKQGYCEAVAVVALIVDPIVVVEKDIDLALGLFVQSSA